MRFQASFAALLAAAATASAQSVAGKAYGFAAGVTGGSGEAVTPATAEELAELLADDTPRVIYIDKEFDFTGQTKTGPGCDRKSCSASNGGQLYLGDLSCGGEDNVAVDSITYDAAGPEPLPVGSNKSIIGNGKAVLKGKGLSVKKGSSNVIIQGIEITNLNPGIVWGGDALELKGENDGVWIDHCKFSKVGRMFIVSHYDGARLTISNSEFDGVTDTSASCNGNHYWTMMFYGAGDQVTLDRNHFHDVAGRAPKLGEPGTNLYVHATNNYFQNMKGHAFDAYSGANAIIEGNVFDGVDQPLTKEAAGVNTLFVPDAAAAAACQAALGRACEPNSATSSGDLPVMKGESGLNAVAQSSKDNIITPVSASEVVALVVGKAGPAGVGSGSAPASGSGSESPAETAPVASESTSESAPESAPTQQAPAQDEYEQSAPSAAPQSDYDQSAPATPENDYDQSAPIAAEQDDCEEETASAPAAQETQATPVADDCDGESDYESEAPVVTQAAAESNAEGDCDEETDYESAPAPQETAAEDDCAEESESQPEAPKETAAEADCDEESDYDSEYAAPSVVARAVNAQADCDDESDYDSKPKETAAAPAPQADCDEESDYDSKPEAPKQTQAASPVADCDEEEPTAKAEPAPQKDCDDEEEGVQAAAKDTPAKETPKKEEASGSSTVQMYGQCGGANFSGSTKCAAGSTCKKVNDYYSQCLGNSRVRRYMHTYVENETQP
ncbi:hypothetical protein NW752_008273 [Fusarium irregulare]|uniref:pectin lyase n=1 Tax=Fusarium irregulare TaxID=2494466 RepID=A0A9W8PVI8_9HYPO|nr:hypothetical protein NW752_008273 [Fusarium irregulare]KAJ4019479.1 hypothetical protein NW766_003207 [Fusarium irregulare]